jgi:hypothetical protein
VYAALASRLPFEVLNRIGDINVVAINASGLKRFVEELSCGTNERPPLQVFLIARLFTHEHHLGTNAAFAKHGLSASLP